MNESQTTNGLTESQPDPDSQPPDLADQRCVASPHSHANVVSCQQVRLLLTNKALIPAFITKAEMRCKTAVELAIGRLYAREHCLSAWAW
jgi:hypothetical protein